MQRSVGFFRARCFIFALMFYSVTPSLNNSVFAADASNAPPKQEINLEDKIIGSTFKALAKAFVTIVDIKRLKEANIEKLQKMKEEKFAKKYAKVYKTIKDLPAGLKGRYAVSEHMAKEQVIENIKSLDKKNIYGIIDSIPDAVIAKQFKQYLKEKNEEIQKSSLVEQINKFWNKMINKL